MRGLVGAVLAVGLLVGCGGTEAEAELQAAPTDESGQVEQASACSDLCEARLNSCLQYGLSLNVCFGRYDECMQFCPIEE